MERKLDIRLIVIRMLIGLTLTFPVLSSAEYDTEQLRVASRETAVEFMQALKARLMQAIQEGGPLDAIAVCNTDAPVIALEMSQQKGWYIARTSLKVRNTANAPDDWERSVLNDFEARKLEGEDPLKLEHFETVELEGKLTFRYMKAIPTDGGCLMCHGESIDGALAEKINALYPQDQATGFKLGDIRGAFTITQPL